MHLIENLEDFPQLRQPIVLTIGTFDGVHRGHHAVLQRVKEIAGKDGQTIAITFRNHPTKILRPQQPTPLLCTLPHKIRLLEQLGVDTLLLLNFTTYLAKHSAASFIENIRQHIPFEHLVLGHDATLGRDRQGNRSVMKNLGEEWGFSVYYIDEYRYEGIPISSSHIRESLQKGDFERVEQLLARPYSIYSTVKILSDQRFSLDVTGLCLPPPGEYRVEIVQDQCKAYGSIILEPQIERENHSENLEAVELHGTFFEDSVNVERISSVESSEVIFL